MLEIDEEDFGETKELQLHVLVVDQNAISLHTITSSFGGSMIRLTGSTPGVPSLHILMDSGCTHNFLDIDTTCKVLNWVTLIFNYHI